MAECTDYLLGDLQAYFPMILNCVCVCFSPQNANLHSPRERLCLVWSYTRKCISRGVEMGKVKNFKHRQKDSNIFNIGLNMFHIATKLSDIEMICEKAACLWFTLYRRSCMVENDFDFKLCLWERCGWENKHGFLQVVAFLILSRSALPVMSNPCAHRGFHLILCRRAPVWWQLMPRPCTYCPWPLLTSY